MVWCVWMQESGKSAGTEVEVATGHRIMYHRLGTDSSNDQVITGANSVFF